MSTKTIHALDNSCFVLAKWDGSEKCRLVTASAGNGEDSTKNMSSLSALETDIFLALL